MSEILNQCPSCYQIQLPECPGVITVKAGLQPDTDYYYFITDKFGNRYYKKVTTDGDGKFTISETDLPTGLLMSFSGVFELIVKKEFNSCDSETLVLCGTPYACVQITFITMTDSITSDESGSGSGTEIEITIPCNCDEDSGSGEGGSALKALITASADCETQISVEVRYENANGHQFTIEGSENQTEWSGMGGFNPPGNNGTWNGSGFSNIFSGGAVVYLRLKDEDGNILDTTFFTNPSCG